jgi:hypothetical protein
MDKKYQLAFYVRVDHMEDSVLRDSVKSTNLGDDSFESSVAGDCTQLQNQPAEASGGEGIAADQRLLKVVEKAVWTNYASHSLS